MALLVAQIGRLSVSIARSREGQGRQMQAAAARRATIGQARPGHRLLDPQAQTAAAELERALKQLAYDWSATKRLGVALSV